MLLICIVIPSYMKLRFLQLNANFSFSVYVKATEQPECAS